ncbi:glycoside hydrolase family 61 protein, partial [Tulasnella calospora MUT 4182]
ITLDGVTYQGADPYGSAISSPIRQVSSNSPATPVYGDIKGVAMACGGDAQVASMTVPMTAGSDVSIFWGTWPHNVGPIITYLGKCNGPCATTDPTKIDFFKIHQVDFVQGTHTWVQSQTLYKGLPFNFTLPEDLPNGDFIMRHEVIALHNAMSQGGAEIFPQCIQVTIDCGGGKIPAATARFPGGYSATDPGILINVRQRRHCRLGCVLISFSLRRSTMTQTILCTDSPARSLLWKKTQKKMISTIRPLPRRRHLSLAVLRQTPPPQPRLRRRYHPPTRQPLLQQQVLIRQLHPRRRPPAPCLHRFLRRRRRPIRLRPHLSYRPQLRPQFRRRRRLRLLQILLRFQRLRLPML